MEPFSIGMAGLGLAGLSTLGAFGLALRQRRRRLRASTAGITAGITAGPAAGGDGAPRTLAERVEALYQSQTRMAQRLDALGEETHAPEARLQAVAGQLLGLVRDKNATIETALAGLDQLRARLGTLEQMGEPAEARALLKALEARLEGLAQGQATDIARLETRIETRLEAHLATREAGQALSTRLAELEADLRAGREAGRAAALEAVFERLGPLETRLATLEGTHGALGRLETRLEARLEALGGEQGTLRSMLAALEARTGNREQASGAQARLTEALATRIGALEAEIVGRDPAAALERFAERLEAVQARVATIETAENPFGEISEQLTRLYAQKDATVETVFARLAPLEAKLGALEAEIAGRDPAAALERFAERLEAVQARVATIETAENPFGEISEQLTRLYAQKDATVETVFARLAPLEAKLGALEAEIVGRDPAAALERFAERLEAVQARVATIETAENPFGEISEQLTRLYAQKDATVETVFARLAPLEAKLGALEAEIVGRDPAAALERFAERLEAVQARVATIETAENPFGEISEQLTRLYAQKDATVETVFARLAPLEAKLGALEAEIAGRDPAAALERFAERLEAVQARVATIETAENPFGEISEQLTRLYAQKDATVETVFARLAPLEAKLGALERGIVPLIEDDPRPSLDGLRARVEALQWGQGETAAGLAALRAAAEARGQEGGALSDITDRLTRLFAQKDASLAQVLARVDSLEERLEAGGTRSWDPETETARAEAHAMAQVVAAQMIAARAASDVTAIFADRITELEAALPRRAVTAAPAMPGQAGVLQAGVLQGENGLAENGPAESGQGEGILPGGNAATPRPGTAAELEAIWTLPRIVSLHRT